MKWPDGFRETFALEWGVKKAEKLVQALTIPSKTSIRIHPLKSKGLLVDGSPISWSQGGYTLHSRPSFIADPLWHGGCYYVQEASSMIVGSIFKSIRQNYFDEKTIVVLDLCAAPGGKSTDIISVLQTNDLLVSNEVIKSRVPILIENVSKWGYPNHLVSSNDPRDFSRLRGVFDMVLVDAPCSGEGLFRKDNQAYEEWSEDHVIHCQYRQKRIVEEIWPSLAPNGILIYSTCTYNKKENEEVLNWLCLTSDAEIVEESILNLINWPDHVDKNEGTFRFWPGEHPGEGFTGFLVRKKGGVKTEIRNRKNQQKASVPENLIIPEKYSVSTSRNSVVMEMNANILSYLKENLNIVKSGITLGEWKGFVFVPHHDISMSILELLTYERVDLDYENSIAFLRGESLENKENRRGYSFFMYQDNLLGLGKGVDKRINNLYPIPWRIKKQSGFEFKPFLKKE